MIRGKIITKGLTLEKLNTIELTSYDTKSRERRKPEFREPLQSFHRIVEGDMFDLLDTDTSSHTLFNSRNFREDCLKEGYQLLMLYPCYYQGWECDEWGAIGIKDGVVYRLETNHGTLEPKKLYK